MFDFLVGDYGIAFGLLVLCFGVWRIFPHTVRMIWNDQPSWRRNLNRGIFVTGALAIVWITAADNWRKFLGVPSGWFQDDKAQQASDPFYSGAVAGEIRFVTWVLFLAAVVGGAYLFARYSRNWFEPVILGPLAVVTFFVFNSFRLRIDVDSVRIAYGTVDHPIEIISTLTWLIGLWVSMGLLIITVYLVFWAPTAMAAAVVYRLIFQRDTYEDPMMFEFMRNRRGSTPGDEGSVTR